MQISIVVVALRYLELNCNWRVKIGRKNFVFAIANVFAWFRAPDKTQFADQVRTR